MHQTIPSWVRYPKENTYNQTYGGGVQSMIGVTGAQRASAEANTTIDTRPLSVDRSNSKKNHTKMILCTSTYISFFSFKKKQ